MLNVITIYKSNLLHHTKLKSSVNVIIWLKLSLFVWPKLITLSGFHFIGKNNSNILYEIISISPAESPFLSRHFPPETFFFVFRLRQVGSSVVAVASEPDEFHRRLSSWEDLLEEEGRKTLLSPNWLGWAFIRPLSHCDNEYQRLWLSIGFESTRNFV